MKPKTNFALSLPILPSLDDHAGKNEVESKEEESFVPPRSPRGAHRINAEPGKSDVRAEEEQGGKMFLPDPRSPRGARRSAAGEAFKEVSSPRGPTSPRSPRTRHLAVIGAPLGEAQIKSFEARVLTLSSGSIPTSLVPVKVPAQKKPAALTQVRERSSTLPHRQLVLPELTTVVPSDKGLDGKDLLGLQFPLRLFGVEIFALYRNNEVWYVADTLLKDLQAPAPDEKVYGKSAMNVNDVEKAGLLRLICHGTSPVAEKILGAVLKGVDEFKDCDRTVRKAEERRREKRRQQKDLVRKMEEREIEAFEELMKKKREDRRKRRDEEREALLQEIRELDSDAEAKPKTDEPPPVLNVEAMAAPPKIVAPEGVLEQFKKLQVQEDKRKKRMTVELGLAKDARRARSSMHLRGGDLGALKQQILEEEFARNAVSSSTIEYCKMQKNRVMAEVSFPEVQLLTEEEVFSDKGLPDLRLLVKHFLREGRLTIECARKILVEADKILVKEDNLLEISAPCSIFGDIHGQFFDLVELLKKVGSAEDNNQLFLGDYVDRGAFGCEVVRDFLIRNEENLTQDKALFLLAAKIRFPKKVFLLRGNHESRMMTKCYNFQKEANRKYRGLYDLFMTTFDALPIGAVVQSAFGRFFCVHGGLSPMIRSPNDLNRLGERFEEPPNWGPVCDLLWSDPIDASKVDDPADIDCYYMENTSRGCGMFFGQLAVKDFLEANELVCIVRAHEVQSEGFFEHRFLEKDRPVPMVITIFSAPNYAGLYENKASFLTIADAGYDIRQSVWVDPPFALSADGTASIFSMSIPWIAEGVMGFFVAILSLLAQDDDDDSTKGKVAELVKEYSRARASRKLLIAKKFGTQKNVKTSEEVFARVSKEDSGESHPFL